MKKLSNEALLETIKEQGYIEEAQINLAKRRSNNEGRDIFNLDKDFYSELFDEGISVTKEQGEKGLAWLKRFSRSRKHNPFGYREMNIISEAKPEDFTFKGFYDAGRYGTRNYLPIYNLNGMEYVPMAEPYIIG